jgi:hypothetical protein
MWQRLAFLAVIGVATFSPAAAASDKITDPALVSSLRTIEHTAKAIAAGRYGTHQRLLGPARSIALAWQRAAKILEDNGYLVEVKQTSVAIQNFEDEFSRIDDPKPGAESIVGEVKPLFDLTSAAP